MTWTKEDANRFSFINEEFGDDGSWEYIDEWQFSRNDNIIGFSDNNNGDTATVPSTKSATRSRGSSVASRASAESSPDLRSPMCSS
jgi:hypothetical protein